VDGRIRLVVGPVPAEVAREWVDNSRVVVAAVRQHRLALSIPVRPPILELIDAVLAVWQDVAAEASVFRWESEVEVEQLLSLAKEWRELAAMTADDLAVLGVAWADERTAPMFDAVVTALADALQALPSTAALGAELLVRPPGRE
jgi:hypothetical protein